ncbi:MAG TPA: hypothetical protein VGR37_07435 [Longimicrobiaceae bacterium]|nr:hypothetical protein [Longimicrobiaceae bacterium]
MSRISRAKRVLFPRRLKLEHLLPLVPALQQAVASIGPGEILHLYPPD